MFQRIGSMVLVLLCVLVVQGPAAGQDDDVAQLKAKVEKLQKQVARLEAEMVRLQPLRDELEARELEKKETRGHWHAGR